MEGSGAASTVTSAVDGAVNTAKGVVDETTDLAVDEAHIISKALFDGARRLIDAAEAVLDKVTG